MSKSYDTTALINGMIPEEDLKSMNEALVACNKAANGDSNDTEIETLRDALDTAIGILGVDWPEDEEDD